MQCEGESNEWKLTNFLGTQTPDEEAEDHDPQISQRRGNQHVGPVPGTCRADGAKGVGRRGGSGREALTLFHPGGLRFQLELSSPFVAFKQGASPCVLFLYLVFPVLSCHIMQMRIHKRIIDLHTSSDAVKSITNIVIEPGVEVEITINN